MNQLSLDKSIDALTETVIKVNGYIHRIVNGVEGPPSFLLIPQNEAWSIERSLQYLRESHSDPAFLENSVDWFHDLDSILHDCDDTLWELGSLLVPLKRQLGDGDNKVAWSDLHVRTERLKHEFGTSHTRVTLYGLALMLMLSMLKRNGQSEARKAEKLDTAHALLSSLRAGGIIDEDARSSGIKLLGEEVSPSEDQGLLLLTPAREEARGGRYQTSADLTTRNNIDKEDDEKIASSLHRENLMFELGFNEYTDATTIKSESERTIDLESSTQGTSGSTTEYAHHGSQAAYYESVANEEPLNCNAESTLLEPLSKVGNNQRRIEQQPQLRKVFLFKEDDVLPVIENIEQMSAIKNAYQLYQSGYTFSGALSISYQNPEASPAALRSVLDSSIFRLPVTMPYEQKIIEILQRDRGCGFTGFEKFNRNDAESGSVSRDTCKDVMMLNFQDNTCIYIRIHIGPPYATISVVFGQEERFNIPVSQVHTWENHKNIVILQPARSKELPVVEIPSFDETAVILMSSTKGAKDFLAQLQNVYEYQAINTDPWEFIGHSICYKQEISVSQTTIKKTTQLPVEQMTFIQISGDFRTVEVEEILNGIVKIEQVIGSDTQAAFSRLFIEETEKLKDRSTRFDSIGSIFELGNYEIETFPPNIIKLRTTRSFGVDFTGNIKLIKAKLDHGSVQKHCKLIIKFAEPDVLLEYFTNCYTKPVASATAPDLMYAAVSRILKTPYSTASRIRDRNNIACSYISSAKMGSINIEEMAIRMNGVEIRLSRFYAAFSGISLRPAVETTPANVMSMWLTIKPNKRRTSIFSSPKILTMSNVVPDTLILKCNDTTSVFSRISSEFERKLSSFGRSKKTCRNLTLDVPGSERVECAFVDKEGNILMKGDLKILKLSSSDISLYSPIDSIGHWLNGNRL